MDVSDGPLASTHLSSAASNNTDKSSTQNATSNENRCDICLEDFTDASSMEKLRCGHSFCKTCLGTLTNVHKGNLCPTCKQPFSEHKGSKLPGSTMTHHAGGGSLQGYSGYGIITINYNIPNGIQTVSIVF